MRSVSPPTAQHSYGPSKLALTCFDMLQNSLVLTRSAQRARNDYPPLVGPALAAALAYLAKARPCCCGVDFFLSRNVLGTPGRCHLASLALPFQPIPVRTKSCTRFSSLNKAACLQRLHFGRGGLAALPGASHPGEGCSSVPCFRVQAMLGVGRRGKSTLTVCFMLIMGKRYTG